MLPGCSRHGADLAPTAVAVPLRDRPPSDLLVCPQAPAGVPVGEIADIPPPVRAALIRLALSYRALTDQLGRLIAWHDPTACGVAVAKQPVDLLPPAIKAP